MVLVTYSSAPLKAINHDQKKQCFLPYYSPISFEARSFSRETISRLWHHIISNHHMVITHAKILRDLLVMDCKRCGQFFLLLLSSKQPGHEPSLTSLKLSERTWQVAPGPQRCELIMLEKYPVLCLCSYICKPVSSAVPCCSYRMSPWVTLSLPDDSDDCTAPIVLVWPQERKRNFTIALLQYISIIFLLYAAGKSSICCTSLLAF